MQFAGVISVRELSLNSIPRSHRLRKRMVINADYRFRKPRIPVQIRTGAPGDPARLEGAFRLFQFPDQKSVNCFQ